MVPNAERKAQPRRGNGLRLQTKRAAGVGCRVMLGHGGQSVDIAG